MAKNKKIDEEEFDDIEEEIVSRKPRGKKIKKRSLKEETVEAVIAVFCVFLAIFFLLSAFGRGGVAGLKTYAGLSYFLGVGYFLLPLILIMLAISYFKSLDRNFAWPKIVGSILFLLSGLGLIAVGFPAKGGILGKAMSGPLIYLFSLEVSIVFLTALLTVSFLIIFDTTIKFNSENKFLSRLFKRKNKEIEPAIVGIVNPRDEEKTKEEPEEDEKPNTEEKRKKDDEEFIERPIKRPKTAYNPPPLELLEEDRGKPGVGDIKANANIIKRTLQNFGINVEMDEISIGPSVTRYALKPAEGIKLSRITALGSDLSLALAAHPIRIEAPIPGKSLVGIEIPNSTKTTVGLGTLLSSLEFQNSDKPLLITLGKGVSGKQHFANLGKMPHLLIAGATGSGKSVAIHTLITSLLYRNSPDDMKFIMIDPKRVELTLYNKIPHLLTPVITDAKKTIMALRWAAKEMDRRYDILEKESVRDIDSYHKNVIQSGKSKVESNKDEGPDPMPFIVIIVDELADIMQAYPRELEAAIVRLAQMSRAVGIHLVLSTQRPSVNVITGLIKANIPARLALQVASQIDSRTILDMSGAEKLLGAGDMLYLSSDMSQPTRIQSAFISETEVKNVVKYLINEHRDSVQSEINFEQSTGTPNPIFSSMGDESLEEEDDMYEEAKRTVIEAGKASTSFLQRKHRLGYARAARLIDLLEERGIIGPGEGAKPREVLVKPDIGGSETVNLVSEFTPLPEDDAQIAEENEEDTNEK